MLRRLKMLRRIFKLRRQGLAIAWNVSYAESPTSRVSFGFDCHVAPGTILLADNAELTLGDEVEIGNYCNVRASESFIHIGSRTLLAQFVSLIAANHKVGDYGVPSRYELDEQHGVVIGEDCWLGVGVTVLPGVELGDRCIVGAGAVVTRSFPAGTRLTGVPARPQEPRF